MPPSVSRVCEMPPALLLGREPVGTYDYYTSFWDEITAIQWVREGQFYDLTVPGFEHYSAQGLWHHNSGKTVSGCIEAFLTAMEYPGSVGLVGRWCHRELMATTWDTLKLIVPRRLIHNIAECPQKCLMDLYAPDGKISRIYGWPLSNVNSIYSLTLDWFYVDEGGQVPGNKGPALWSMLTARLRGTVGPLRGWLTGNPNGRDWIWKQFINQGYRGYKWVHAPTRLNLQHLPDGYEQDLRRTNSREWNRRFLDAEFNEFEGAIYWNWSQGVHVFKSFEVPDHWPRFLAMDWGLADPCAALLFASDERGNVFVLDEYYQAGQLVSDQCKAILAMCGGKPLDWAVIDPSAKGRDKATGKSLLDQYRENGLHVVEANNRLFDGIALVQEALQVDPDREHPLTGALGSPRLHVSERCRHLQDEFAAYRWGPNGKPTKDADHALDALRYGLMRRPHAATPLQARVRRASADAFWRSVAAEAVAGLPAIGAGARGALGAA